MAFTIPSPTPTSVTNHDWVNQLAYLVVAKEKLRQDYNSHGDQFEAQTLSEEDWVAYRAWWEPICVSINEALNNLPPPPEDLHEPITFE